MKYFRLIIAEKSVKQMWTKFNDIFLEIIVLILR